MSDSFTRTIDVLEEAARRANWDAQHGPRHLRTGRFFISDVFAPHAWREPLRRITNGSRFQSDPLLPEPIAGDVRASQLAGAEY